MGDIASVKADWKAASFFKSGEDLASLMNVAIGPITPALLKMDLPPVEEFVPDFTAGLLYGFTGNDHRAELEGCMTDLDPLAQDMLAIVADAKAGHFLKIGTDLGNVIWMLPDAVSSCGELTALQADLDVVTEWAEILKHPAQASKMASKNWLFHGVHVKKDITTLNADYESADYYGVGTNTADIALTLLPPQTAVALPPVDPFVPDFTAGLIKGFTGNDHRVELEGCMTDVEPLSHDIVEALNDLKHFHVMKVASDLGNFIWMLPDAVKTCGELTTLESDVDALLTWASVLKEPLKVSKIAAKNWIFHGTEIKADIEKEEADWAAADYYSAGQDTAAVLLGLVPANAEEKLMLEFMLN